MLTPPVLATLVTHGTVVFCRHVLYQCDLISKPKLRNHTKFIALKLSKCVASYLMDVASNRPCKMLPPLAQSNNKKERKKKNTRVYKTRSCFAGAATRCPFRSRGAACYCALAWTRLLAPDVMCLPCSPSEPDTKFLLLAHSLGCSNLPPRLSSLFFFLESLP